jgi:hypothetical protein
MAAARHNLTRRALLGAGVGACALPGAALGASLGDMYSLRVPTTEAEAGRGSVAEPPRGHVRVHVPCRWDRALAAFRRAEAKLAAFKAAEGRLPAAMREWPRVQALERRFGDLDTIRLAALRRLLRAPAPDIAALALKLDLAVADQAWELTGCESCLAALAADARRLSANSSA